MGTEPRDAFDEGYEAHDAGKPETANPYEVETDDHLSWNDGWHTAADDDGDLA